MTVTDEDTVRALVELGLSEQKAKETLKNAAVTKTLKAILHEVGFQVCLKIGFYGCFLQTRGVVLPDGAGILLYHLATKIKPQILHHLSLFVKYVVTKKLDSTVRVDKAIEFGLSHIDSIDTGEFEKYCGVGVVVTPEQIEKAVEKQIGEVKNELLEKRYKFNTGLLMQKVRTELPWADGKAVKNEVDLQVVKI